MRLKLLIVPFVLMTAAGATTRPTTNPSMTRTPQYPLKDRRTLFSDDAVAQARENVAKNPSAKAVANSLIKIADEWVSWDDAEFATLIAPARVPRAFDVSAIGCPKCGNQITEKFGGYAWIVDPKLPFEPGEFVAAWAHEKEPSAKVRIRVLEQPGQQLMLANARVSPAKFPQVLTYVIARRQGENLASRFISVIEPFEGEPLINSVRPVTLSRGAGTAVEVLRSNGGSDLIVYDATSSEKTLRDGAASTDAQVAVVRRDASGKLVGRYIAGGSALAVGDDRLETTARTGPVVSVEPGKSQIRVKPDQSDAAPEHFVGRVVYFRNDIRRTAHTITSASRDGDEIVLTASDDLLVGRARVDEVRDDALTTHTAMPLATIYRGVTLAATTFRPLARVREVENGDIRLATPLAEKDRPSPGEDVWVINVGPGDWFELPAVVDVPRERRRPLEFERLSS